MTGRVGMFDPPQNSVPWWVILLTGISAVILGFLLLTSPGITTQVLVQFLGAFWFVAGIFSIVEIFSNSRLWGWKLLMGVIGILAGLTVLQHPMISAILVPTLVVTIVAIEGIIYGGISIVRSFSARSLGLGILGVLSVVFGVMILMEPLLAAMGLPFLIGILGLVGGGAAIVEAFRVRGREREGEMMPASQMPASQSQIPVTGPETDRGTEEESDRPQSG